jgi:hypothetical protein
MSFGADFTQFSEMNAGLLFFFLAFRICSGEHVFEMSVTPEAIRASRKRETALKRGAPRPVVLRSVWLTVDLR